MAMDRTCSSVEDEDTLIHPDRQIAGKQTNRQTHRHTKSHVKHAVSFIKHKVGHPLQVGCLHFDQVNQSPLSLPIHIIFTSHTISPPPPLDYGTDTHIMSSPHPSPLLTHKQCHGTDTHIMPFLPFYIPIAMHHVTMLATKNLLE